MKHKTVPCLLIMQIALETKMAFYSFEVFKWSQRIVETCISN